MTQEESTIPMLNLRTESGFGAEVVMDVLLGDGGIFKDGKGECGHYFFSRSGFG